MATYRRDRETYRYALSRAEAFATAEALYESESENAFSLRGIDSHALFAWHTRWPEYQGMPSKSRRRLSVEYMEGSPNSTHPLKGRILELTLAAAEAYGRTLGAKFLRLSDPAPGLVAKYEAFGFALVIEGRVVRYCERRIS